MNASRLNARCGSPKIWLPIVLISSLCATCVQPGFAIALRGPRVHAQLAGALTTTSAPSSKSGQTQFIVRDSIGLPGLNLTCLLLGCNVLESIGDPTGQLFVVQNVGSLDPVTFLTQLLSAAGIVDAELDQNVSTLGATIGTIPPYLTDKTPIWYYGAQVWEGYVIQTPNQIVNTTQTHSTFRVSGRGVTVAMIDTGIDPNNSILAPHLVNGYDFTRNTSGGSEMGDINQSTAGVIDGSTQTAQVNQSTAGVIDGSTQTAQVNQSTAGVIDGSAQTAQVNQSTAGVIDQGSAQVINQAKYSAFGHGTMTAGIVHLVAPRAQLMPLKAFNANGTGYASDVLRAIYYAVNHNAKVISMSFEFASPSLELANAINYATISNVICVASAGNDGAMTIVYPSGLPNVIDVASTSNTNTPSSFSNYGTPPVWISAPGEAVMSTYPFNTYAVGWGTSFSTPFVSGTVALMANWNSGLLNQTSAAYALSHAQPIPESQYGFGVLDTYQAVQAWKSTSNPDLFDFNLDLF